MSTTAAGLLTDGKAPYLMMGTVVQSNVGTYEFMMKHIGGKSIYMWRIEGLTSADATPTIKPVYRFEDTTKFVAGQIVPPSSAKASYTITMINTARSLIFGMTGGGIAMLIAAACGANGVIMINEIYKTPSITLTNAPNTITVGLSGSYSMWFYELPMAGYNSDDPSQYMSTIS